MLLETDVSTIISFFHPSSLKLSSRCHDEGSSKTKIKAVTKRKLHYINIHKEWMYAVQLLQSRTKVCAIGNQGAASKGNTNSFKNL